MSKQIPQPLISLLSNKMSNLETHSSLDSIFLHADVPGEMPNVGGLNKSAKIQEWLLHINRSCKQPLNNFGKVIEKYMELPDKGSIPSYDQFALKSFEELEEFQRNLTKELQKYGLSYINGGIIADGQSLPSKDLKELIHEKNIPAINLEFERALKNVNAEPLDAVSASCNLLESICKVHIEDRTLDMPTKQDLRSLWKVVSKNLGLDASKIQDDDLKRIISGMFSIIDGISALRTHGSSAHGQGKILYRPAPRHARFAVNSAHSLALFLLETSSNNES